MAFRVLDDGARDCGSEPPSHVAFVSKFQTHQGTGELYCSSTVDDAGQASFEFQWHFKSVPYSAVAQVDNFRGEPTWFDACASWLRDRDVVLAQPDGSATES